METIPHPLFDHVRAVCRFRSDAHMGGALEIEAGQISRIRHGKGGISDYMIIRMHEATGEPIAQLRQLAGLPPTVLGRTFERSKVSPEMIDKISKLTRYCVCPDGKMHPGAVSTHSFMSTADVLAALQS